MKEITQGLMQFFDGIFLLFWGVNSLEILAMIGTGGVTSLVANMESVFKMLFSLVGLLYAAFRLFKEFHIWKIDQEIKKQDLREKKIKNNQLENEKDN